MTQPTPTPSPPAVDAAAIVTRMRAFRGWVPRKLDEPWGYRELLYFRVWRDVKVLYKRIVLGFVWAILRLVFSMIIIRFNLGRLTKASSDGIPYALFSFAKFFLWAYFQTKMIRLTTCRVTGPRPSCCLEGIS